MGTAGYMLLMFTAIPESYDVDYGNTETIAPAVLHYHDRTVLGRYVYGSAAQFARYRSFGPGNHTAQVWHSMTDGQRYTHVDSTEPMVPGAQLYLVTFQ